MSENTSGRRNPPRGVRTGLNYVALNSEGMSKAKIGKLVKIKTKRKMKTPKQVITHKSGGWTVTPNSTNTESQFVLTNDHDDMSPTGNMSTEEGELVDVQPVDNNEFPDEMTTLQLEVAEMERKVAENKLAKLKKRKLELQRQLLEVEGEEEVEEEVVASGSSGKRKQKSQGRKTKSKVKDKWEGLVSDDDDIEVYSKKRENATIRSCSFYVCRQL